MMFRDKKGRLWSLALDIGAVMRVRDLCGLDMLDWDTPWGGHIIADKSLAADVVYAIAEPQVKERSMDDRQFGKMLRRQGALNSAMAAMADAWQAFLPEPAEGGAELEEGDGEPFGWQRLFQCAGFVGVDPRPFTLRELLAMTNGRYEFASRIAWEPGSLIAAGIKAQVERKSVTAASVNPWHQAKDKKIDFSKPRRRSVLG